MHLSDDHRLWPPPSLVLMLPPPVSRSVSPVLQLPQVSQPHPLIHLEKNEFMDKIIKGVAEDQLWNKFVLYSKNKCIKILLLLMFKGNCVTSLQLTTLPSPWMMELLPSINFWQNWTFNWAIGDNLDIRLMLKLDINVIIYIIKFKYFTYYASLKPCVSFTSSGCAPES